MFAFAFGFTACDDNINNSNDKNSTSCEGEDCTLPPDASDDKNSICDDGDCTVIVNKDKGCIGDNCTKDLSGDYYE